MLPVRINPGRYNKRERWVFKGRLEKMAYRLVREEVAETVADYFARCLLLNSPGFLTIRGLTGARL